MARLSKNNEIRSLKIRLQIYQGIILLINQELYLKLRTMKYIFLKCEI